MAGRNFWRLMRETLGGVEITVHLRASAVTGMPTWIDDEHLSIQPADGDPVVVTREELTGLSFPHTPGESLN